MNRELSQITNLKVISTKNCPITTSLPEIVKQGSDPKTKLAKPKKKRKKKQSYKSLMSEITSEKPNDDREKNKQIFANTGGGVFSKLDRI